MLRGTHRIEQQQTRPSFLLVGTTPPATPQKQHISSRWHEKCGVGAVGERRKLWHAALMAACQQQEQQQGRMVLSWQQQRQQQRKKAGALSTRTVSTSMMPP